MLVNEIIPEFQALHYSLIFDFNLPRNKTYIHAVKEGDLPGDINLPQVIVYCDFYHIMYKVFVSNRGSIFAIV